MMLVLDVIGGKYVVTFQVINTFWVPLMETVKLPGPVVGHGIGAIG
jgi:hypothetical protein